MAGGHKIIEGLKQALAGNFASVTLQRAFLTRAGWKKRVSVAICECGAGAYGPIGGICLKCEGAIPSIDEQRALNNQVWEKWTRDNPHWARNIKL